MDGRLFDLTKSAMHFVVSATFAMPREPAVMAMRMPGFTLEENFSWESRDSMIPGISSGSILGRGNTCFTLNIFGMVWSLTRSATKGLSLMNKFLLLS